MKIGISTIVAFICCNLELVLSTPSIEASHNSHVQCLGSTDHASDSCTVSAIFPQHKDPAGRHTRKKRQFINDDNIPSTCISSDGSYGICVPYHQCYSYFKMSAILQYQSLFMGVQDSCTYPTSADVREVGICCKDNQFIDPSGDDNFPGFPSNPELPEETPLNELPTFEDPLPIPNWPPPLPTHPPVNGPPSHWPPTIPTRPTYPPGPGRPPPPTPIYPPGIKPTTKPPYKPPLTKPPYRPPVTQRPPWAKPTTKPPMTRPPVTRPPTRPPFRPTTKPPVTYPTTESEVEDINYSECGIKNGDPDQQRIVGGKKADPGEWPWMAAIMVDGKLFCGGSLIDSEHILTAAHCVAHMSPWDVARIRVNLGDYDIKSKWDGEHIERRVMKVVRHAGFDPNTLYNDIAVLTLDTPIQFTRNVRPICLPAGRLGFFQRIATVIGWGSLKEMGPTPNILQEVNIRIWDNQECRRKYGPAAPGGIIDTFLCAGETQKDSCSGDSGGPLMVNDGKWQQVGIVSWGIGCGKGQFPGVYTRMTSYMTWLYKNLNI